MISFHLTDEQCFAYFNPLTEQDYVSVVNNWTTVALDSYLMNLRVLIGNSRAGTESEPKESELACI